MNKFFPKDGEFLRRSFLLFAMGVGTLALIWFITLAAYGLLLVFAAILVAVGLDGLARLGYVYIGISRHLWVIISATAIVVLLGAGLALGGFRVVSRAPQLQRQIAQSVNNISSALSNNKLTKNLVNGSNKSKGANKSKGSSSDSSSASSFGQRMTGEFTSFLSVTVNTLVDTVVVAIIGLYLALEPQIYQNALLRLFPPSQRRRAMDISINVADALRRWLLGRSIAMVVVGVFSVAGLFLIGVPFALLLGLLAGVLTFIPYLGAVVSSIPALLVAALQGLHAVIYVGLLYLGLHIVEGYILMPLVQKRAVSMAPAFLLIAQVLGGAVAGVLGITLATPIALVIAVLVQLGYVRDVLGKKPHLPGKTELPTE